MQSRAAARGIKSLGLHFLLCSFHVYAAVIEYSEHKLQVKDSSTLIVIVLLFKFTGLGRTVAAVVERWDLCARAVLPHLPLGHQVEVKAPTAGGGAAAAGGVGAQAVRMSARAALDAYVKKEWLCDFWILAWTAAGRFQDRAGAALRLDNFITTNNYVERLWITVVNVLNRHRQFKRIDYEVSAITGYNATNRPISSMLDKFDLKARDYRTDPTEIPTAVQARLMLALLLVIREAVTKADGLPGIYYVKAGQSSAKMLRFGAHSKAKQPEFRMNQVVQAMMKPLAEHRHAEFTTAGVPSQGLDGQYCVDVGKQLCECSDSLWTGLGRGHISRCKHLGAARLVETWVLDPADAKQKATFALAKMLQARERRLDRKLQVTIVANGTPLEIIEFVLSSDAATAAAIASLDDDTLDELRGEPLAKVMDPATMEAKQRHQYRGRGQPLKDQGGTAEADAEVQYVDLFEPANLRGPVSHARFGGGAPKQHEGMSARDGRTGRISRKLAAELKASAAVEASAAKESAAAKRKAEKRAGRSHHFFSNMTDEDKMGHVCKVCLPPNTVSLITSD